MFVVVCLPSAVMSLEKDGVVGSCSLWLPDKQPPVGSHDPRQDGGLPAVVDVETMKDAGLVALKWHAGGAGVLLEGVVKMYRHVRTIIQWIGMDVVTDWFDEVCNPALVSFQRSRGWKHDLFVVSEEKLDELRNDILLHSGTLVVCLGYACAHVLDRYGMGIAKLSEEHRAHQRTARIRDAKASGSISHSQTGRHHP